MLQRGGPLPAILILPTSSTIGEGNGNPLQYSWLGNPMDRGAWHATVQGVTKNQTQLKRLKTTALTFGIGFALLPDYLI